MADTTTAAGAAHTLYDVLKDFQPMIAALVALAAASLAYRGAMAKVELDREMAARQRAKDRLGLLLRFTSQLRRMKSETERNANSIKTMVETAARENARRIDYWGKADFSLEQFGEIDRAWDQLELLPSEAFELLEKLREDLLFMTSVNNQFKIEEEIAIYSAQHLMKLIQDVHDDAVALISVTESASKELSLKTP
jgi:hypothetical protein